MKNPWIKLYRNVLNDEKVAFILRRYGHDCLTFWVGLLTKCEDGLLTMDEEIFADLCLLETKRFEEIRGVFIKRGLVELDAEGRLFVVNWAEYQQSESTDRVRRFRDSKKPLQGNAPVTPCNADVTACNDNETGLKRSEGEGELEEDGEEEGEGERAGATPPVPAYSVEQVQDERLVESIVSDWYAGLKRETWADAPPSPRDYEHARAIVRLTQGDFPTAQRMREEYFSHWRELWFACAKADKDKPADKRAPDFDFRAYCANAITLAARVKAAHAQAAAAGRRAGQTYHAEPPPSLEERAAAGELLSRAAAGPLGAIMGAAS